MSSLGTIDNYKPTHTNKITFPKLFNLNRLHCPLDSKEECSMIHTIDLFVKINTSDLLYFRRHHNSFFKKKELPNEKGISVRSIFKNEYHGWCVSIHIEAIKLLGKHTIAESDLEDLKKISNIFLKKQFGLSVEFDNHVLKRIDYRFDSIVPDDTERQLIIDLFTKVQLKRYRQIRKTHYTDNEKVVRAFETSCYHSSKGVSALTYDKEAERKNANVALEKYEESVLRFEVSVRYTHLYGKSKAKNLERHLDNYFKKEMYNLYMQKYILDIFPESDFYKLPEAEKVISSSSLKNEEKRKLKSMLVNITNGSVDTVKRRIAPSTFKKYMQLFKSINVHPILIQKRKSVKGHLENPLKSMLL